MRYKEWRKQRIREELHAKRDRSFDPVFQAPPGVRYLTDEEEARIDEQAETLAAAYGYRMPSQTGVAGMGRPGYTASIEWARDSILAVLAPSVRSRR